MKIKKNVSKGGGGGGAGKRTPFPTSGSSAAIICLSQYFAAHMF